MGSIDHGHLSIHLEFVVFSWLLLSDCETQNSVKLFEKTHKQKRNNTKLKPERYPKMYQK